MLYKDVTTMESVAVNGNSVPEERAIFGIYSLGEGKWWFKFKSHMSYKKKSRNHCVSFPIRVLQTCGN